MSVNMNEFPIEVLNTLLTALASYHVDLRNKIDICDDYDLPREAHAEELERVNLLVTQALNAKADVIVKDMIQSN